MIRPSFSQKLDRLQLARARGRLIVASTMAQSHGTVALGGFLTGYALYLGANERDIGLLAALSALAQIIQLASPYLLERSGRRRPFCYSLWIPGYALWLPVLLLPWFAPDGWRVLLLLVLVGLNRALVMFTMAASLSWVGDLVPADVRGRFFGRVNMIAGSIAAAIGMLVAWGLDALGRDADAFAMVFLVALLLGIGELLAFAGVPEPPWEHAVRPPSARELVSVPLRDPWFRRFALFVTFLACAQATAGPFFVVYMIRDLGINYMLIGVFAAIHQATMLAFMPLWGYLGDKYGHHPVFRIGCTLNAVWPLIWLAAVPGLYLWPLVVAHVFAGVLSPAIQLGQTNLMLGSAPEKERSLYYALFNAMSGLAMVLGPLLGAALAGRFANVTVPVGQLTLTGLPLLFVASALLRLSCLPLMPKRRREESEVRVVLSRLVWPNPLATLGRIHALVSSRSEVRRASAARDLGKLRARLAVEELTRALNDASPQVRQEAARALGDIGDPQAVEVLIDKLHMEAEDIIEEAAEALGKIGDERAVTALVALAVDEDQPLPLRVTAMTALGNFPHKESEGAALEVLRTGRHPGLLAAAAGALGHMESSAGLEEIYDLLGSGECRVVRKQIAHALGEIIGEGDRIYGLLEMDEERRDSQVARILAVVRRRLHHAGLGVQMPRERMEKVLSHFIDDRYTAIVKELATVLGPVAAGFPVHLQSLRAARWLVELAQEHVEQWEPQLEEALLVLVAVRHLVAALQQRTR